MKKVLSFLLVLVLLSGCHLWIGDEIPDIQFNGDTMFVSIEDETKWFLQDGPIVDPIPPTIEADVWFELDFSKLPNRERGFSEEELRNIVPAHWYLGGELDDYCETAGRVDYDGKSWLRSYHDKGTCCVESQSISNGGSGIQWVMFWDEQHTSHNYGFLRYRLRFDPDFVSNQGGKLIGIASEKSANFGGTLAPNPDAGFSIRNMHKYNEPGYVDIQWYIYPHLYADYKWGRTHSREGSGLPNGIIDRLEVGKEYEITLQWFSGDLSTTNGFVAWYRDKVCIDVWTGLNFNENPDIQFNVFSIATFYGGSGEEYQAPDSTYYDIAGVKFFDLSDRDLTTPPELGDVLPY